MDENNIPRYAALRGTSSKRFMGEASGSDKTYSFKLDSIIPNDEVHVFESAIDLLSFATLKELNNDKWDELNLLSLAGVYKPPKIGKDYNDFLCIFLKEKEKKYSKKCRQISR